jgi:transposase
VLDFATDFKAHSGDPAEVRRVLGMSAAYAKGAVLALSKAAISYDRFHVIAIAIQAITEVRREELRIDPEEVAAALLDADPKTRRNLPWGMRKNPAGWTVAQTNAMHWLHPSALKSTRAWRLRMALPEIYGRARHHNSAEQASGDLTAWTNWARRCRWSRSINWPRRSTHASTPSCAACSITAAMPSSRQ